MNAETDQAPLDVVDQAVVALRDSSPSDLPPAAVVIATIKALQELDAREPVTPAPARNKRFVLAAPRRVPVWGFAAAAMLLVGITAVWLMDRAATVTFAQVIENVRSAKSVRFVLRQKLGDQPLIVSEMAIQGDRVRYTIADALLLIVDFKQHQELKLELRQRIADRLDLKDQQQVEMLKDPIEQLRNIKDAANGHVKQLNDEELEGHNCHVFKVKGDPKREIASLVPGDFTLWVDAKTGFPFRIVAESDHASLTYERFEWDQPFPDQFFSLSIPDGYRLRQVEAATIKPDRIYFSRPSLQLDSIQPDGHQSESQFLPRLLPLPNTYVSSATEMSPDGRVLAMAFTNTTNQGSFPPDQLFLWDRTRPEEPSVEVSFPAKTELNSWFFSPDGQRLYVNWWAPSVDSKQSDGHTGADWIDLRDKSRHPITMPMSRDVDGKEHEMRLGAATADGQTYLVIGHGLHVATADGKLVRRLSAASDQVVLGSVRLSPDGRKAAYVVYHPEDGSNELSTAPLSGGEPKQLVVAGQLTAIRPRWSPDSKRIAYSCRSIDAKNPPFNYGSKTQLRVVDPDGQNAGALLSEQVNPRADGIELMSWR